MSFNLIDLVKDQLGEQVMGQLGGVLGGGAEQNSSTMALLILYSYIILITFVKDNKGNARMSSL